MIAITIASLLSTPSRARQDRDEKGESAQSKALKNRRMMPKAADMDKAVTLSGLLEKKDEGDWSAKKAATIEGYVVQVEKEEDGDFHIVLAEEKQENNTKKWAVVEMTPAWRAKKATYSDARLRGLVGKKVRVTGWLFYEPEEGQHDPRGTRWELHPVTAITVVK